MLNESKLQNGRLIDEKDDIHREKTRLIMEKDTDMANMEELRENVVQLMTEKEGIKKQLESLRYEKTEIERKKEDEILALKIDLTEKINNLQKELQSISTQKLESDECLKDEITNKNGDQERLMEEKEILELKVKELEKKIEEISKEMEKSLGSIEVKIRLTNQKLRVTEQILNETEHEHATKEEKLHQENKSLMVKISTLSQTITAIKREVQDKVNETLTGIDSLTVKFEEVYGHVTTGAYEFTNEIQAAQIHLKKMKEDMKQKVEKMVMKLQVSKGENDKLMMVIVKKDERIKELEKTILVKDEWISNLGDDKREAIKQLCIWADYQRDNLQELVLKTTVSVRRNK